MMSLVAYDSEISDSEEEQDSISKQSSLQNCDDNVPTLTPPAPDAQNIFKSLPLPKSALPKKIIEDTEDEFLKKKEIALELPKKSAEVKVAERKPAKIFLPSLSSFDDEILPVKKFQPSVKGTGLLSLLPQPKGAQNQEKILKTSKSLLIPDSVKKKALETNVPKVAPKTKHLTPNKVTQNLPKYDSSDDSDLEENVPESSVDFFSLKETSPPLEVADNLIHKFSDEILPDIKDYNISTPVAAQSDNVTAQLSNENYVADNGYGTSQTSYYEANPSASNNHDIDIDNETLRKLCGSRARHKGENVQFIDINQQEILPDPREWLTKALTEDNSKRTSSSKRRGDEPTTQQRRKHQITYLAHQAKANEQELQNQWANNRLSKKQTQSKYGF